MISKETDIDNFTTVSSSHSSSMQPPSQLIKCAQPSSSLDSKFHTISHNLDWLLQQKAEMTTSNVKITNLLNSCSNLLAQIKESQSPMKSSISENWLGHELAVHHEDVQIKGSQSVNNFFKSWSCSPSKEAASVDFDGMLEAKKSQISGGSGLLASSLSSSNSSRLGLPQQQQNTRSVIFETSNSNGDIMKDTPKYRQIPVRLLSEEEAKAKESLWNSEHRCLTAVESGRLPIPSKVIKESHMTCTSTHSTIKQETQEAYKPRQRIYPLYASSKSVPSTSYYNS